MIDRAEKIMKGILWGALGYVVLFILTVLIKIPFMDEEYIKTLGDKIYFAFDDVIFSFMGVILFFVVLYIIFYLVWHFSTKQDVTGNQKRIALWFKVLFFVSLLVYVAYIYQGISAYVGGTTLGFFGGMVYGWEAVFEELFWFTLFICIIPILPVCLIIQIVFIIKVILNKRANKRIAQNNDV